MSELRYQDVIPLRWTRPAVPPSAAELDRLDRDNERLLRLLPALENPESVADDAQPRQMQLLELRLQLLTDLLGELLAQANPLPPARALSLSVEEVSFSDETPPPEGEVVILELYLSASIPRPLRLPVRVSSAEPALVTGRLEGVGEPVRDLLQKLIFRQHRRAIAIRRGR